MLFGNACQGLIHDEEEDDRLPFLLADGSPRKTTCSGATYVFRIDRWNFEEIRPVNQLKWLLANTPSKHGVGEGINISDLIVSEDELLPTPHLRLRRATMNLILEARHNAEIVSSASERPKEVRRFRLGGCDRSAIGKDHTCRNEVVSEKTVTTLQPAVATA